MKRQYYKKRKRNKKRKQSGRKLLGANYWSKYHQKKQIGKGIFDFLGLVNPYFGFARQIFR